MRRVFEGLYALLSNIIGRVGKWLKKQNLAILEHSESDLQSYKSWAYTNKQKRPATVNRYLATLRRFYRWAQRIGYLPAPPQVPKCLPPAPSCIRWLTVHQQRQLIRTMNRQRSIRDRAIIFILLHTGLRAAELCALQWKDIHMTERSGSLCVRQAKGQRERTVPLNAKARAVIHQLGYERNAGKKRHLLQGQRGPLVSRSLQRIVGKYAKQAGLATLSPHSFRHTFCKNLVDAQIGLETVARLAGHTRIETTKLYCQPSWQDLERAVAVLAKSGSHS